MMPAKPTKPRSSSAISKSASPEKQISEFLAKYSPEMIAAAKAARKKLRARIPGGTEFIYDNYNALVFGYGPTERPSEAVLSLAMMPGWVTVCFLKGTKLSDPTKILRGSGNVVRNVRLIPPWHLDHPEVVALVRQAIETAKPKFAGGSPVTIIKSVSAKQRPRRKSK